ncbi:MAG: GHKL domain-containing protein [Lachnospiraceae bacterium]|nr:GHKL domain-containing protein [Lachnospiraceae bacterium]
MYEVVSWLLEIVSAMFQGYCLQYFYGSFLESRMRNRRINGLAATVLYGVLRIGAGILLPQNNGSFGIFMRLALPAGIMAAVNYVFYRAGGKMRVFLIAVFMAVSEISVFLAYTFGQIGNVLIAMWGWCMEKEYIASASVLSAFVHVTVIGINILVFMVSAIVMYCLLKGVAKAFQEKSYGIGNTELLFLITPSLMGVLVCSLLRAILLTVEDGTPKQIYDRYPSLIAIVPAILILSLLSIVFGVRLFQDMIYRNREKSSRIILEKQVSSLQEHMGEMERVYSGIRGMKHDMKNTLSVIMQLASGKEELQAYLEELNQTMSRLEFRFKTGNTVVDTLLNMKYHEITNTVPDLRMDVEGLQFPEKLFIQSYDIGIILGNALDNAMEACRKLKAKESEAEAFIRISSFQKRELFFLKVENSFDGRLVWRRQEEFPMTDKADRENHGIGLANIKSTAEKYHGTMDFKVNGRVFILSVMMKNEKGRSENGF